VTGFTAGFPGNCSQHSFLELPIVRIAVTLFATEISETELRSFILSTFGITNFVAFGASGSQVCAGELELCLLVARQSERGRRVSLDGVARFAAIQVRRCRELRFVHVVVAIETLRKLDLEARVFAGGNMALCAIDVRMLALQRIQGCRVVFYSEQRWLESIHVVTRFATAAIGTLRELSAMGIRAVAVGTIVKCQRPFEIAGGMAFVAGHFEVFSQERILRPGVVETGAHVRHRNSFPTGGDMTRLAGTREAAVMRIGVARIATIERQIGVARLSLRVIDVAFRAGNFLVRSGQRVLRFIVVKFRDSFPVVKAVTLLASRTKAPLVLVAVAGSALV